MGIRLLKISAVYFLLGIILGMFMSITHQFSYAPSHAHISLLGWASLALAGIIYHLFPDAAQNKLATSHFWLHNIGLPVMMIGLIAFEAGKTAFEPVIAIGASLTSLGVVLFVINIFLHVKANP